MIYQFLDFELDTDIQELRKAGAPTAIEPQVFDLLLYLIDNREQLVSHDHLIENVWRGRIVADATIASRIRAVRKVLGDTGARQAIIQTVSRRGFRFLAPVSTEPIESGEERLAGSGSASNPKVADKLSIAVLPFNNLSSDPEQEFLADGLTEDITTALSRHQWLFVIARNSAFVYKGQSVDISQVGRDLGVRYVLEGSVRRAGDRIRATAQLIDAETQAHVWAERYDRVLTDVFDLQDDITASIVGEFEPSLLIAERDRLDRSRPNNLNAWECIVRATPELWTVSTAKSIELLKQALQFDPNYARAYSLLACAYAFDTWRGTADDPGKSNALAEKNARRSIELDSSDPWAHLAIGLVQGVRRQSAAALSSLDTALRFNPNFSLAHAIRGIVLAWSNRVDEALPEFDLAERLSPNDDFNKGIPSLRATALYIGRRYEEAVEAAKESLNLRPNSAGHHRVLAASCAMAGYDDEARSAMKRLAELQPAISAEWMRDNMPISHQESLEHYIEGLVKAGMLE